jgi:hypothetical protein
MKLIINKCPNGFTLSEAQKTNLFPGMELKDIPRHDQRLIESFEAGDRRGDGGSSLVLVEIPDNATYKVVDVNGYETLYWSESPINTL